MQRNRDRTILGLIDNVSSWAGVSATGGTVTYSGGKTIHTFTSSGTFSVTSGGLINYLIVRKAFHC